MATSPIQSNSKCNSDFSIERILNSDSVSRRNEAQTPEWLCCTRYRPPRLPPRAVNGGGCRVRRSGRHARVPFTATQAAALEAAYSRAPYLAPPALRALAAALHLRDDRIKIWFQNRRARERREKCANISPPVAVTLPPTRSHVGLPASWTAAPQGTRDTYSIETTYEDTFSVSTDDDRCDSPLDIETIDE